MPNDSPDWQGATDIPPQLLTTLQATNGQTTVTAQVNPPASATGMVIALGFTAKLQTVTVTGGVSGAQYQQNVNFGSSGGLMWVPLLGNVDNPLTVTLVYSSAPTLGAPVTVAWLWSFTGAGFSTVWNNKDQPLQVQFAGTQFVQLTGAGIVTLANGSTVGITGQPIGVTVSGQPVHTIVDSAAATLAVSQADWPGGVSTLTSKTVLADIASNATSSVLAGVGGKVVTIYAAQISVAPANPATAGSYGLQLQSITSSQGILAIEGQDASAVGWQGMSESISVPMGLPLPVGEGVQMRTDSLNIATARCRAVIVYTQA